jgi:hypothetical protein
VGHRADEPLQLPAGAAMPAAQDGALHCVPDWNVFAGQLGLTPLHASSLSQMPFAARH